MGAVKPWLFTVALAIGGCLLAACMPKHAEPAHESLSRGDPGKHTRAPMQAVEIMAGTNRYQFDPATWALAVMPGGTGTSVAISAPVCSKEPYQQDGSGLKFVYPHRGISVRLEPDGASLRVHWSASRKASLDWPCISVPEKGFLILPRGEGSYIPVEDSDFRAYLSSHEMNTLEDLNMPFWGIERPDGIVTYVLDNPFHNRIAFKPGRGMTMSFTHDFPNIDAWRTDVLFEFFVDDSAKKIAPAEHFRSIQAREGGIRTLSQKAADLPRIDRLIGAPHAYLWSEGPITEHDVLPDAWKIIATYLLRLDQAPEGDAIALRSTLTADDREALKEVESLNAPHGYLRTREAEILSKAYQANSSYILKHLAAHLRPRKEWGGGISTRMMDRLSQAGFDKFLLVVPDWSTPDGNPYVAAYAEKKGYLFGTYDSYDSIHDPRTAGTDDSWPTAQFDKHYYEAGRISDTSGNQLKGFNGIGYLFSPIVAMPAVKERVQRNFRHVPYSYYFIDCDAFGQYYDDYTGHRMVSQFQDAQARIDRVSWVSSNFKVPVGSEGGSYLFSQAIEVAEGIDVPVMGWGDPVFTSKDSKYYLGRYYPPSGPEKFFKPVPLPDKYYHLFIDPRYRLPLYQAVYHDSVITTPHWGSSSRKFTTTRKVQALIEILYQAAPLYHLNFTTSDAELGEILSHAKVFEKTHEYSYRYAAKGFHFLDTERLVQRIRYGDMSMTANFSAKTFEGVNTRIPAGAIRIEWPDGEVTTYAPGD